MTSLHLSESRLNEYAEDLLGTEEREAAAAHVAACPTCAAQVEEIRSLRDELAALPTRLDPRVDLRPGIRSRVHGRTTAHGPFRETAQRRLRSPLAAAAAVVLVAAAAATALLVGRGDGGTGGTGGTAVVATDDAGRTFLALDREYGRAASELRRTLESADGGLDPGTASLLRESLSIVDRAVAESRAAMAEDPSSPVVRDLVLAAHRQRLDVLRRATALATES